jgi:hypothetical protein
MLLAKVADQTRCTHLIALQSDEHRIVQRDGIGEEKHGCDGPTLVGPYAQSGRAAFSDQMDDLGKVCPNDQERAQVSEPSNHFSISWPPDDCSSLLPMTESNQCGGAGETGGGGMTGGGDRVLKDTSSPSSISRTFGASTRTFSAETTVVEARADDLSSDRSRRSGETNDEPAASVSEATATKTIRLLFMRPPLSKYHTYCVLLIGLS